jgi:hypothetical protein
VADAYRQILDLVISTVTGCATTGARVYESPAAAIASGSLPALAVEPVSEEVAETFESADSDDHLERHRLTVAVWTIATSIADRDASAGEVKQALVGTVASYIGWKRRFTRSEFQERVDGEKPLYAVGQRFEIDFHVTATQPDVIVTS